MTRKSSTKRLQVQIPKELYLSVDKRSSELGFDSVNQVVRLMLQGFANQDISFGFFTDRKVEHLDEDTRRSIVESIRDINAGNFVEVDMNKVKSEDELSKLWRD